MSLVFEVSKKSTRRGLTADRTFRMVALPGTLGKAAKTPDHFMESA